jgi:uncharacterized membrane protein YkvA (DUF1232 family)
MAVAWWQLVIGVLAGLAIVWAVLVAALTSAARRHPSSMAVGDMLRLVPDVARLLKRLVFDGSVPIGVRIWLIALLAYLLSPLDLIPDFVPVIGYADDAIMVAIAIRFATRRAGRAAIERHWPGTAEGLHAVFAMAGLERR